MDDLPKEVKEVKKAHVKKTGNSAKILDELRSIKESNKSIMMQLDSIFKVLSVIKSSMATHLFSLCFLISSLFVIHIFFSN